MSNFTQSLTEIAVATSTSLGLSSAINFDPLWTALITLGVSVVTQVGGAVIKYLVSYFKNRTKKLEDTNNEK